jgi:cytochrome P450
VALEDVAIRGAEISAGDTVIALISAANAELVGRGGPIAGHLVFGAGAHRCLGERLVRMQVEAAMAAAEGCPVKVTAVKPVSHRTPSFRGYREIRVKVEPRPSAEVHKLIHLVASGWE